MTNCIIALSLIITPSPVTARQETHAWQTLRPSVLIAEPSVTTSLASLDISVSFTEPFGVEIEPPAPTALPVPDIPPPAPPPLSPIEQGLNRLSELGATDWQLRTFGCIAWFESGNNPNAWNAVSHDDGLWQLNERYHAWRWAGRDIFDPIVNAEIAWDVYRESGFRAWVVHGACGV